MVTGESGQGMLKAQKLEGKMQYKFHEAANEFPMMPSDRLSELKQNLLSEGMKQPIVISDGKILDGRNRYLAATELQKEGNAIEIPETQFNGGDPWAFVWSLNGERRDLTQDQRYLIWKSLNEKSDEWQRKQEEIQEKANQARSEAAKAQHEVSKPWAGETLDGGPTTSGNTTGEDKNVTATAKATASKTNRGTVERMDRLEKNRPDLAEKVKTGDLPGSAAIREMRRDENVRHLEGIVEREAVQPTGQFDVIVIDPPWPMQKIERDAAPDQVNFDYPVMSEEQLGELDIPAADDCHIWLWTTQKFIPMAFRLLDKWQFKYICTFVWHKNGGFQPFDLPQFNCEFALYARKGSPVFLDTKEFFTCFDAPRKKHSEKPEEFYDVLRRVTGGRRLDMFNRREIEGFKGWGNESQ